MKADWDPGKEPEIIRRIRAALERARWRHSPVKVIYLDPIDSFALDCAVQQLWPSVKHVLSFDDYPVSFGRHSAVYLASSERIRIPKSLSKRVGKPPAKVASA